MENWPGVLYNPTLQENWPWVPYNPALQENWPWVPYNPIKVKLSQVLQSVYFAIPKNCNLNLIMVTFLRSWSRSQSLINDRRSDRRSFVITIKFTNREQWTKKCTHFWLHNLKIGPKICLKETQQRTPSGKNIFLMMTVYPVMILMIAEWLAITD